MKSDHIDFQSYLNASAREIQQQISKTFIKENAQNNTTHQKVKKLIQLFMATVAGGKCIRGGLVKLGYELSGSSKNKNILKIAAAYEILHASLLTHDDIIDQSFVRRGKPTIHTALGNNHYGTSQAICLGDLGFFLATKLIAESNANSKIDLLFPFFDIVINTILGEMLDIELSSHRIIRRERDVMTIQKAKTAQYTIIGPLLLGAMVGNASHKISSALAAFGKHIGIAFQIQDDILGTFGNEIMTGKSANSDIEEGKNTLLITFALQHGTHMQKKILQAHYGRGKLNNGKYEIIKDIFRQTGALEYSKCKATNYIQKGKKIIPSITSDTSMQKFLNNFADFIIERQN